MTGQQIIAGARSDGRRVLTEVEAKDLLKEAGIDVTDTRLAVSREEALSISGQMGYPAVLKIVSPDVIHKTDSGGVKLGIENADEAGRAYDEILESVKKHYPEADIRGVSVQPMARPGVEVIIGISRDPQFGPVLMFGLGGILVEVLKDVSFRIVPLAERDARQMITEIKGYALLEGYRGQEPADVAGLEKLILKVSDFAEKHPEIEELDLNPVFAYSDGAVAVDARVMLEESD